MIWQISTFGRPSDFNKSIEQDFTTACVGIRKSMTDKEAKEILRKACKPPEELNDYFKSRYLGTWEQLIMRAMDDRARIRQWEAR